MLKGLEDRDVTEDDLMKIGRGLSVLILPIDNVPGKASIREMLARRLLTAAGKGVRLRLRLPRILAGLPWEYTYVDRAGGDGMDGFLALDPRVAFVRDEVFGTLPVTPVSGDLRVVVALASAPDLAQLDLAAELKIISTAMNGVPGATLTAVENATLAKLQAAVPGAHIFHFAGHGDFAREMGDLPGTYTGTGALAFQDQRVDAEQLGINLRGQQVRLAVLAGCETGRREGLSVWSGIAPALTKVDIPAVVANQYSIKDTSAIAFSERFYQALAGGLPLEDAVAAGRLAVYNQDPDGRDWGVPVLYLRAANGQLFEGVTNPALREQARSAAQADVVVRTGKVGPHGVVYGAEVHEALEGKLSISVTTGDVVGQSHRRRQERRRRRDVGERDDRRRQRPGDWSRLRHATDAWWRQEAAAAAPCEVEARGHERPLLLRRHPLRCPLLHRPRRRWPPRQLGSRSKQGTFRAAGPSSARFTATSPSFRDVNRKIR